MAKSKKKTQSPPAIDKLIVPAIGVGLALLGYQFYKGLNAVDITRVDVQDDMALREVFFGEVTGNTNYAVLCKEEGDDAPISSVFGDAASSGNAPAAFRIVDCKYTLPDSEKTIAERFKLDLTKRPTIFVSGKGGPPKQIPQKHLKTGAMLVKALKNMLERRAVKIETTQDFRTKCLNQQHCALLLKGTSKSVDRSTRQAMEKLMNEQPKVAFAHVDTTNLYVLNLEDLITEHVEGTHRFVVFEKVSGSLNTNDSRLITSYAALPSPGVSYVQMSNLLANVLSKSQPMKKLTVLPQIKSRTKKLLQKEQAKKQRQEEKAKQEAAGSTAPPTANDGSREGRRAERERRRAEHRAKMNVKPKTPEEIAEMERKRRQRMEEEAAKWNMAPDDAPEEGDIVDEEDEYDLDDLEHDDGNDGEELLDMDEDQHGDDEDVLDLD